MKKKAAKAKKFSKHDFLIVALIVVAFFNTCVHFSSPAYKFYKENFQKVFVENGRQFDEIRLKLIPVLTNQLEVLRVSRLPVTNCVDVFSTNSVSLSASSPSVLPRRVFRPQRVFVWEGEWVLQFDGFVYSVGCPFDDGVILSISPTYLLTTSAEYFLRPDFKEDLKK